MTIEAYVNAMKERFVIDPMITSLHVTRERSTWVDGHLRARLGLAAGSQLEVSEYMPRSPTGEIVVIPSSSHSADADHHLITRWDNTPPVPDLSGFPNHVHDGATGPVTTGQPMSICAVLDEIAGNSR